MSEGLPVRGTPTRRYEIRDAAGTLVAVHERFETPRGKFFHWRHADGALAKGDLRLDDLPLYGIDRLGASRALFVVEGEKACEALWAVGLPAVATVCGASSTPSKAALAELTGRLPVLWPDNDAVGVSHMERISKRLAPLVGHVGWVRLADAGKGADAADALAGADAARVEELWRALYPALVGPGYWDSPETAKRLDA